MTDVNLDEVLVELPELPEEESEDDGSNMTRSSSHTVSSRKSRRSMGESGSSSRSKKSIRRVRSEVKHIKHDPSNENIKSKLGAAPRHSMAVLKQEQVDLPPPPEPEVGIEVARFDTVIVREDVVGQARPATPGRIPFCLSEYP